MKYLINRFKLLFNLLVSVFVFYYFLVKKDKSKPSMNLDLVVFSKDRPFQLKSYLLSVLINMQGINSITVLYTSSSSSVNDRYAKLLSLNCFKNVCFVQQKRSFKIELVSILKKINSSYIMFAVDDMLVFDKIDVKNIILNLKEKSIFSTRLGRNIKHSYTLNKSQALPDSHCSDKLTGFLSWKVKDGVADFSYPMSVDMHILPLAFVKSLSKWLIYTAPNSYEGALNLSSVFIGNWNFLSFSYSKCVNLPLNKVQDENDNRSEDDASIDRFMVDFDNGYCFDPGSINKNLVFSPHQALNVNKIKCQKLDI